LLGRGVAQTRTWPEPGLLEKSAKSASTPWHSLVHQVNSRRPGEQVHAAAPPAQGVVGTAQPIASNPGVQQGLDDRRARSPEAGIIEVARPSIRGSEGRTAPLPSIRRVQAQALRKWPARRQLAAVARVARTPNPILARAGWPTVRSSQGRQRPPRAFDQVKARALVGCKGHTNHMSTLSLSHPVRAISWAIRA